MNASRYVIGVYNILIIFNLFIIFNYINFYIYICIQAHVLSDLHVNYQFYSLPLRDICMSENFTFIPHKKLEEILVQLLWAQAHQDTV